MSQTLRQIVDLANRRVPNGFLDPEKVSYLDNLQRSLYRKFDVPERIEIIYTTANTGIYTLPEYIIPGRIKTVTLLDSSGSNPAELDKRGYTESADGNCFYTLETATGSLIRVSPTPTEDGGMIVICFKDSPNTLSSDDMTTVPRFLGDYADIYGFGLAVEIARWRKDYALVDKLKPEYNICLQEAINDLTDMTPRQIKCV